ncbi:MAG: flagellar hook-associated protein FlgK [Leptospiraceae bacterium]|nr:flagellar hook-associated protein FlgK [Leptospiraceae bacterium]
MPSTFMGIEIARRGIATHQQALTTTGHNISNADNKNYSRQRVDMETMHPLYEPSLNRASGAGHLGQGPKAGAVERIRDEFVDGRIHNAEQAKSQWETREKYLHQVEVIYNEPSDDSLRAQLDRFWQSWQELAQFPEEMSHRELVRTRGREVTFRMRDTFQKLSDLRRQADFEFEVTVGRINDMATQIRDLNDRILKAQAVGDRPNDLMDKRDHIVQELSKLADITLEKQDPDEFIVYLGGEMLVQGRVQHKILVQGDASNEGMKKATWEHNGQKALFRAGSAQGLLEMRDITIRENIEKMDMLAINLADTVNEVHRDGFGLTKETNINFFRIDPLSRNIRGNYDLSGDGVDDVSAIFKVAGKNALTADRPIGVAGTMTFVKNDAEHTPVYITYRPDMSLNDVIQAINRSDAGIVAYLNHNNNLVLKGREASDNYLTNFMIRHIEDSGEFLTGFAGMLQNSGAAGAFDYRRTDEINKLQSTLDRITLTSIIHPAGAMHLSNEVEGNTALIAAGMGKDVGGTGDANMAYGAKDGGNATRIAQAMRHKQTMVGEYRNSDEFYNALIAKAGIESKTAKEQVENQKLILTNLENLRQSVMGVNLDEEMAAMVQFQHGYNAAARIMQTMNELLDKLINHL